MKNQIKNHLLMSLFRMLRIRAVLTSIALIGSMSVQSEVVSTIVNDQPRRDVAGAIIDAHDGRIIQFRDTFYLYGTAYGTSDGYGTNNHFHCYRSTDLTNWTLCGDLLTNPPVGVYYRPHVVYNAKRKKYVLWYNWYKTLWSGQYGVAISDRPTGPFTIISQQVTVKNQSGGLGDFNLFVDEDAKGYLVYTTIADHVISVERLTDDYMGSLQTNSGVILPSAEACAMFKRNGLYYVLADKMCQFCPEGSGAQVFTAQNPLGPYVYRGNINNVENTKYPADAAIDGDRVGANWGNFGGWNDNTIGYFPDSLEVAFNGTKSISEVHVVTVQDGTPSQPTEGMTFSKSGITSFDLEYWDGLSWRILPGGSVSDNKLVWRKFAFSAVSTTKVRLIVRGSKSGDFSRVIELEAYENGVNVAAKTQGGSVRASSEYLDASENIIHAQQTHVAEIPTPTGTAYVWMADRWGSRPDGVKGHDFQYWGEPLDFRADGSIARMHFVNRFDLTLRTPTDARHVQLPEARSVRVYVDASGQLVVQGSQSMTPILAVMTVSGATVFRQRMELVAHSPVAIAATSLPKGIYLVRIEVAGFQYVDKICVY